IVAELEILSLDLNQFHFGSRAEADVGAFAGIDVADDRLDECAQISGRTVIDFEHNGRVAVVLNCHSFAKIVCRGHERKVKSLKRSAEVTRAQSNFKRVRSCESTMPTGTLSSSMTTRSSMRWRSSRFMTSTASLSLCTVTGFNVIRSATSRSPILESA